MSKSTYRPFSVLKNLVDAKKHPAKLSPTVREEELKRMPETLNLPEGSDDEVFQAAMRDVVRLGWSDTPDTPPAPIQLENPKETEDEALRLLEEYLHSHDKFDFTATSEYVERAVQPIGRWILKELHSGRFSVQAYLDLHGYTVAEARLSLDRFIRECVRFGFGCVRIVHGRGHHSAYGRAVLKEHVQHWLATRRLGRHVVAFASARLCDGGGGALYVLLRQNRWPRKTHKR